jgi:hypothetical protein
MISYVIFVPIYLIIPGTIIPTKNKAAPNATQLGEKNAPWKV